MLIYLAEITAYDPGLPGATVLRYGTHGYTTGRADTPADTAYLPRIQQPALMQRACFDRFTTGGQSRIGYGELVLTNPDGELDALLDYGFDGRLLTLRLGEHDAAYPGGFTTIIAGTMEQPEFTLDAVRIRVRDRQAELAKPVQLNRYAGSNALPAGLEGVAGDLKGRGKPRLYGTAYNIAPPCVNTARLIYQVSDGAIATVSAAYDRGVALAKGADYVSQTDMETTAPAAANFRVWPAGGFFRLGSSPAGVPTCDASQGAAAANRTAAQLIKQVLLDLGIAAGDISAADVTALDTDASAEIGYWASHEADIAAVEVLDALSNTVGAWWGVDRAGGFRMAQLKLPSGTAVAVIDASNIISIQRRVTRDDGAGVPAWRVSLGYKRMWTVQDTDLAGAVTDARRAELREEYRRVKDEDAAVKTAHLLAPELAFDTLLIDGTAATTECTRRLTLYKARRDLFDVRVRLDAALAAAIDLGAVVTLVLARFGLAAGKLFRVIAIRPDLRLNALDLTLFG